MGLHEMLKVTANQNKTILVRCITVLLLLGSFITPENRGTFTYKLGWITVY